MGKGGPEKNHPALERTRKGDEPNCPNLQSRLFSETLTSREQMAKKTYKMRKFHAMLARLVAKPWPWVSFPNQASIENCNKIPGRLLTPPD